MFSLNHMYNDPTCKVGCVEKYVSNYIFPEMFQCLGHINLYAIKQFLAIRFSEFLSLI